MNMTLDTINEQYQDMTKTIREKTEEVQRGIDERIKQIDVLVKEADKAIKEKQTWTIDRINEKILILQEENERVEKQLSLYVQEQQRVIEDWLRSQTERVESFLQSKQEQKEQAVQEFTDKIYKKKIELKIKALK